MPPRAFSLECRRTAFSPGPHIQPSYLAKIVAIDDAAETVTLQNVNPGPISLDGWHMCSVRGGQQRPIGGPLSTGEMRVFPGPPGTIWGNASSDPGALYDPEGRPVSYSRD